MKTHHGNRSRAQVLEELEDMSIQFDDSTIEEIMAKQSQIEMPFRLAVAPPMTRAADRWDHGHSSAKTLWSPEEVAQIEAWGERAKQAGLISDLILMPSALLRTGWEEDQDHDQLRRVRAAAARQQADAVLILNSVTGTTESINAFGVLDLTIIGAYVIPSHKLKSFCAVEALVLDVRNEFLYFSARGQAASRTRFPAFKVNQYVASETTKVREDALRDLGKKLIKEAQSLATRTANANLDASSQVVATP